MPTEPVRIDVADDPRLADYRELKDAAARRRIEGDELFVAEGPVAIERMLASGHRPRSVLVSDTKWERMGELLQHVDAPVYVVTVELLQDIVGFDLHRGAIAAADRRPPTDLDQVLATPGASPSSRGSTIRRTSARSPARHAPSASTRCSSIRRASTRTRGAPCA
jgi:tRNA G18 (ribose-2'-O)-methylase SpoU